MRLNSTQVLLAAGAAIVVVVASRRGADPAAPGEGVPAVRLDPPPPAPHHNRNPLTTSVRGARLLSKLQLPWFTWFPPRGYGVLTTTGRTTGRLRRTCVRAPRRGSTVYVVAIGGRDAGWVRNIDADSHVALRLKGGTFDGRARHVDSAGREEAMRAYCADTGPFELLESLMHLRGRPRRSRIRQMHRHWFETGAPLVIDLDGLAAEL